MATKGLTKSQRKELINKAEARLNLEFHNKDLLIQALTHPSFTHETGEDYPSFERLEFLGDGLVDFIISEELLKRATGYDEGMLTQAKTQIVRRAPMAKIARQLGLGELLLLGEGEEKTGGRDRASNLENVLEAVCAAVYLDRGFQEAKQFVLRIFEETITTALSQPNAGNYKGALQELCIKRFGVYPSYILIEKSGPDHSPHFVVELRIRGTKISTKGEGGSRKEAEQDAAAKALRLLKAESVNPN